MSFSTYIVSDNRLSQIALSSILSNLERDAKGISYSELRDCLAKGKFKAGLLLAEVSVFGNPGNQIDLAVEAAPGCPLILFSSHQETFNKIKSFPPEVSGAFVVNDEDSQIRMIVDLILDGNRVFPEQRRHEDTQDIDQPDANSASLDSLTIRELEVLRMLSDGQSNKEIARRLKIATNTVHAHVSSIFKKMNVCNRTQAAIHAKSMLIDVSAA